MNNNNIIVIGASAGGLKAITELISRLPQDINAAVFAVLHLSKDSLPEIILHHLQASTPLTCKVPKNNEEIKLGHVYLAPPDHHMMIEDKLIKINKGPRENRWRPSIDVLFRTAAANYGSRVTGIILTGLLDDGTSGMAAIKRCGGVCIVQEPDEAAYPDMPNNVIRNVEVDYQVPIADMGYIIEDVFSKHDRPEVPIPDDIKLEADITSRMTVNMDNLQKIAVHSTLTCPDCGGGLWHIKDDAVHRYRCHTGHVYNEDVLLKQQQESLEESIWVSIRMLEERRNLLLTMAGHDLEAGNLVNEAENRKRASEAEVHIERLKALLMSIGEQTNTDL